MQRTEFPGYTVVSLEPGPDLEFRAREALIAAQPGTILEFPEGTFAFTDELTIDVSHVALRGQGPDRTTLDFTEQQTGAQGLLATGDAFAIQDLRVLNPKGDGVRIEGVDGATIQNLHVEWSGEPRRENGAYGIYPVLAKNVLIEGCYVRGASDAGIYVGQSEHVVLRRSRAEGNVAGIEIENTKDADVYWNVATDNTGGLLVFDGPGLQKRGCRAHVDPALDEPDCKGTRVYWNWIHHNNRANFAWGGTVALVPPGAGLIILATDTIEVFDNVIHGNDTANVSVVSHILTQLPSGDPSFDPYPERIDIHDNEIFDGSSNPQGDLGIIANLFFSSSGGIPDIAYDGYVDPAKADGQGDLLPSVALCLSNNVDAAGEPASYGSLHALKAPPDFRLEPHQCSHPARAATELAEASEPPEVEEPYTPEEIAALCDHGADPALGVNWDAFVVDCPDLADYRLFQDPTDPTGETNGGMPFDLTTPLFSDYARKDRVVFVPPGLQVDYETENALDFPVGTILAKTFSFAHDMRRPALGADLVETRLLIHRPEGWVGRAYLWSESPARASLALGGGLVPVSWFDGGGTQRATQYQVPSANQCERCHFGMGAAPLGPRVELLNRELDYGAGVVENQLVHWTEAGLLAGAPADPADAPRLPVWDDPADGTLDQRARAYLDVNCAHCHSPAGAARQSGLYLEAFRPLGSATGLCKTPVSAGPGAGGLAYDIDPGNPLGSIFVHRMLSNQAQVKMPELARSVVHEEGVDLVSDWIASLPGDCP
jgi:parallel beta-helix repeat protein